MMETISASVMFRLASASPRRSELLALTGWKAIIDPVEVDEQPIPGEGAQRLARRLASAKARRAAEDAASTGMILAADTVVADGDQMLGKPADPEEAKQMLLALRGRDHRVITVIVLIEQQNRHEIMEICETLVPMRNYGMEEIEAYIASGSPLDKAGAYGIQDGGFQPVASESLQGCYTNVMGLPLCHLVRAMRRLGHHPPVDVPVVCRAHTGFLCPVSQQILGEAV
jgi:MAF protein